MTKPLAIIAAGGTASRLGGGLPKSLVRIGASTYLEILLRELQRCGLTEGVVYTNRREYLAQVAKLCPSSFCVKQDAGFASTIELVKLATAEYPGRRIIFFYGHAPREASHITRLIQLRSKIAASLYVRSSRTAPFAIKSGGFLEPPYLLETEAICLPRYWDWNTLLHEHQAKIGLVLVDSPNEFNSRAELDTYAQYVMSWFREKMPNHRVEQDAP